MSSSNKSKEEILAEMDDAAKEARKDFDVLVEEHAIAVKHVGEFFRAHYLTAGYKRLARMFMNEGG